MVTKLVFLVLFIFVTKEVDSKILEKLIRSKRVVNGQYCKLGSRPFVVSIRNNKLKQIIEHSYPTYMNWSDVPDSSHICGAALISESWIISAEHCLFVPNGLEDYPIVDDWYAAFGFVKLGPNNDNKYRKEIPIDRIIRSRYLNQNRDIILMHLKEPIKFNQYIKPICIRMQPIYLGIECIGIGWGTPYSLSDPKVSPFLKEYSAIYQEPSDCFVNNYYCFLKGSGMGCRGDSGGPMICRDNSSSPWQLVGVASFASGCTKVDDRIFYANISKLFRRLDILSNESSCLDGSLFTESMFRELQLYLSNAANLVNHDRIGCFIVLSVFIVFSKYFY